MPAGRELRPDSSLPPNLYIDHLVATIAPLNDDKTQPKPLKGLKIVADCANGATSVVVLRPRKTAGADVIVINASPDGYNINKNAGSTNPEQLQAMVKATDAVMGVAFDGDADRCLAMDEDGNMINGDQIMGIPLVPKGREGASSPLYTLVVTVMSNLGLKLALKDMGIKTVETAVGDRYVLEEMLKGDYSLGGEQSGHGSTATRHHRRRHLTALDSVQMRSPGVRQEPEGASPPTSRSCRRPHQRHERG